MLFLLVPVQSLMERHKHREKMVKMLDAFKSGRLKRINELRQAEVEKSLLEIVAKVCVWRVLEPFQGRRSTVRFTVCREYKLVVPCI